MPMNQRRRPRPLILVPRQSPTPTGVPEVESPDSPDSPDSTGLDSPDLPSPTGAVGDVNEPDSPTESPSPTIASTAAPGPSATEGAGVEAPSSTDAPAQTTAAVPAPESSATSAPQASSSSPPPSPTALESTAVPSQATSQAATATTITDAPSSTVIASSSVSATAAPGVDFSSEQNANQRPSSTVGVPPSAQSETAGAGGAGGAAVGNEPPQKSGPGPGGMSKGAEAALITFTVLGGLALLIGAIIFFRRRRRAKQESQLRHADDAFNPSNTGSLHTPETVHVGGLHDSRSTTTNSLFAAATYERPETVSTDRNNSRIPKPQPTPNPFADPPLNKAYDVLRGRPRSTTLTDGGRESWARNPFQDPGSERFDPFGELQEKARMERVKYMEELRLEQEMLERERMALGAPDAASARKGSGVTVEGYGVLDRSGDERYLR